MEGSEKQEKGKKKITEIETFNIPFDLEDISKGNITITTNNPSNEQIINQAFKFHSQGNIIKAAKLYQYCVNNNFQDHRIFSNYGLILQGLSKLKEAELSYRKAIEINPSLAEVHSNLGIILRNQGKLKEAELSTRKAIEIKPDYAIAYSNLGIILRNQGKLKEAELSTRKAIEIKPDYAMAHSNMGNILKDLGKLKEAELSTRKAIEIKPDLAEAHYNLGNILKDLGKLKEAELSTRKAIEIKPNYAIAYSSLAIILRNLGKLKEAELSIHKAIEIKPDYAIAYSSLGNILKDLGKLNEAELSYRKAIEIKPDLAEVHYNLLFILRYLGKFKELLLLSESTLASRSIDQGYKLLASLEITIAHFIQGDFSKTILNLNRTNESIKRGDLDFIKESKNKKNTLVYSQFITSLYPHLLKENNNQHSELIPHIGESHCLSFAHQTLSISSQLKQIQPVLIMGGKAWHFANDKNNEWKDSLTQQIKNHNYSDKVLISFGEIDCRKDEGILNYAIKSYKDIAEVCENTVIGYLDYMEAKLSPNHSKRYYFGIPAPTRKKELLDELDIKRIKMVHLYNSILKKEVLSRDSYFLDVYNLTSSNDGENNNIYMCDDNHLSPKCLSILFDNYLYRPNI